VKEEKIYHPHRTQEFLWWEAVGNERKSENLEKNSGEVLMNVLSHGTNKLKKSN
jgi:hypothetical protein